MSTTPIIQFGTSRFLQAHVDLFLSEATDPLGGIAVVQSSGNAQRAGRLNALAATGGYPVHIRGRQGGRIVDETRRVRSITRAFSSASDWAEICRIAVEEAQIILSNTSDAGFRPSPADKGAVFDQAMSYPAKLTQLLYARYQRNPRPIQVMPTELVARNGDTLRDLVMTLANARSAEFAQWIASDVTFVNSLVDRIVSEPIEPAGAVAEPYALWAIEDCKGLLLPCTHPAIKVVPSLEPVETRKLFLLNLGHSYLVDGWISRGRAGAATVRDLMDSPDILQDLQSLYRNEVVPGFAAADTREEAELYVRDVLDRFANPFLAHQLQDIAQNHREKVSRRIGAFIDWAAQKGCTAPMPRLRNTVQTMRSTG
ncbi:mannitol dehydrogenase family protein [Paracoccus sp. Z330]|uniref:Mannitol dehydrogenase family protein n=1 Tax=Paracoccus onchidii TaxID=3017813 RepID=A0ABT4ZEA7_9RHOB|nr:mannitol dehydrogenase family protein [Paracoccus onchidii]MDB6177689.1 mannitol dehydrogenase family protein [Paracoccus onchidii]